MRVKGGKTVEQLAHDIFGGLYTVDELPAGRRSGVTDAVAKLADAAAKAEAAAKKKAAPKKGKK